MLSWEKARKLVERKELPEGETRSPVEQWIW
jgi:hypothetical protein